MCIPLSALLLASLAMLGVPPPSAGASSVVISEYPVSASAGLAGITTVPGDGKLWFADGNNVDSITPDVPHTVTKYPLSTDVNANGLAAVAAAAGRGKLLWFTSSDGIGSLDVSTDPPAVTTVKVDASPDPNVGGPSGLSPGIASDAAGNPWFGNVGKNTIDCYCRRGSAPAALEEYPLGHPLSGPRGFTVGPDGNIWFTEDSGNRLGDIDPRVIPGPGVTPTITDFLVTPSGTSSIYPEAITTGPDGNLWFTDVNGKGIGRATTGGVVTEFGLPDAGGIPKGMTSGPDGNLWFAHGTSSIGRISPTGMVREFPIGTPNVSPAGVTTGPDGAVWFTEALGAQGTRQIGRVNLAAIAGPPLVLGLSPAVGAAHKQTSVTINGFGFFDSDNVNSRITGVKFGNQPAAYIVNNNETITALSPDDLAQGFVDVVVTSSDGRVSETSPADVFTFGGGGWTEAGALVEKRQFHTATLLDGPRCRDPSAPPPAYCGMTLVAGGDSIPPSGTLQPLMTGVLNTAELYDPAQNTWRMLKTTMLQARAEHTATLLDGPECHAGPPAYSPGYCGKVLVVGGRAPTPVVGGLSSVAGLRSAELYDPAAGPDGVWIPLNPMTDGRLEHTATLLKGSDCGTSCGRVLVAGGTSTLYGRPPLQSAELYDPASGLWSDCSAGGARAGCPGNLSKARLLHTATSLEDGRVLLAGGLDGTTGHQGNGGRFVVDNIALGSAELFNPGDGTFTATNKPMAIPVFDHTATLLSGPRCSAPMRPAYCGKVLVAGGVASADDFNGNYYSGVSFTAAAELYDPVSNTWGATGSLRDARGGHTASLLPGGKVLVAGSGTTLDGFGGDSEVWGHPSAELYDPGAGAWGRTLSMTQGRGEATATVQSGPPCGGPSPPDWCGGVLVAGGTPDGYDQVARAEFYAAAPTIFGLSPATGPMAGQTPVVITGSGFAKASKVTFGGQVVPARVDSSTQITTISPAGAKPGPVDVVVGTSAGDSATIVPNAAAVFTYNTCGVPPAAGQVAYPQGVYSLIGDPAGTIVASDSLLYGWTDRNSGAYDHFDPAAQATESAHGYWAWFACSRPFDLTAGSEHVSFPLGAYHASMVGNPSRGGPAKVTGHDFAASWDPTKGGGAGGYLISGYQEAQILPVGYGTWVFSYRDATVDIRSQN